MEDLKRIRRTLPAFLLALAMLVPGGVFRLFMAAPGGASGCPATGLFPVSALVSAPALVPPAQAEALSPPAFLDAAYHPELAENGGRAQVDLSCVDEGYVAVSAVSDMRLKFQVVKGEEVYNYDLDSDGEPGIFPLQSGSGNYRFRVMENVVDKKYSELYAVSCDVALADGFQPFLRPSSYVDYTRDSACVQKAAEIAAASSTSREMVMAIYDLITRTVTYDREKAATVKSGYLPDPDETLRTGKGICFDYAALAAAMLRSQGVPTKMIFGYVAPKGLYHAWNMFYTEETGWVTVSFDVNVSDWSRIDLTFSANGADADFIGDGSNYTDVYCY